MKAYVGLNPDIPIFQISNYYAVEKAFDSVVFDNRGYIIGMHITLHDHHNLVIHFYALKR